MHRSWLFLGLAVFTACHEPDPQSDQQDLIVDTESELAWQQYLANLEFAKQYRGRCDPDAFGDVDHRVIVTGFGRFQSNGFNATGGMVSVLLPDLEYPVTVAPDHGQVDPPGPQTAVAQGVIELPGAGRVGVCAMVLPVFWDLAPYLIATEIAALEPDMVLMNGIAGWRQEVWIELGAVNRAKALDDGSTNLRPDDDQAPLVPGADPTDYARPNLASWRALRGAVDHALADRAGSASDGVPLSDIIHGTLLAGYPRTSNTYLCNNTTYTVGYLMDHAAEEVTLMEASHVRDSVQDGLRVSLATDMSAVPRLFMHWPSDLRDAHLADGAALMLAAIDAQLVASRGDDPPARGDNAIAELPANESLPADAETF